MYDLAIVGAGWAGITSAIRAKEAGLRACLIHSGPLGGTCLNQGCIPTKTLIQSAKIYSLLKKSSIFGIEADNPRINVNKIHERKDNIILQLRQSISSRLAGIDLINSHAKLISHQQIKTEDRLIGAKSIIIATGSLPASLAEFKFDAKRVLSSDELINLKNIPDSLLIVGAGVIGCEFAGLFSTLGSRVTLAEKMPQLLPGADKEVAKKIELIFKKKGIKVNTGIDSASLDLNSYALILVCVGRKPNTSGLGLEEAGIKLENNKIVVDDFLSTNVAGIYAAGDCTGKLMLAHYAAYQGRIVVENIFSSQKQKEITSSIIPNCIFTDPQIASIGLKEESGDSDSIKVHKFDLVSQNKKMVVECKKYYWTKGGNPPSAKFATLNEAVFYQPLRQA